MSWKSDLVNLSIMWQVTYSITAGGLGPKMAFRVHFNLCTSLEQPLFVGLRVTGHRFHSPSPPQSYCSFSYPALITPSGGQCVEQGGYWWCQALLPSGQEMEYCCYRGRNHCSYFIHNSDWYQCGSGSGITNECHGAGELSNNDVIISSWLSVNL